MPVILPPEAVRVLEMAYVDSAGNEGDAAVDDDADGAFKRVVVQCVLQDASYASLDGRSGRPSRTTLRAASSTSVRSTSPRASPWGFSIALFSLGDSPAAHVGSVLDHV